MTNYEKLGIDILSQLIYSIESHTIVDYKLCAIEKNIKINYLYTNEEF